MGTLLVQLSDLHFEAKSDDLILRGPAVARAILAKYPNPEGCILLLTGDIANTGHVDEYAAAERFLHEILAVLTKSSVPFIESIAIPGNHDCDLRNQVDTRSLILSSSLSEFVSAPIDFNGFNFEAMISVQSNFFAFESRIRNDDPLSNREKLYRLRQITVGDRTIVFHCINTAWLSRRNEVQGQLFIPEALLIGSTDASVDLSVALLHHPSNWINASNARRVFEYLQTASDVILTGHEHHADGNRSLGLSGYSLDFLQAPAFNDTEVEENGFQVIALNDANEPKQLITLSKFRWTGSRFTEALTATFPLQRNAKRPQSPFINKPEFLNDLEGMGTGFQHPRCGPPGCTLRLRDLYVYPDLMRHNLEEALAKSPRGNRMLGAEKLLDELDQDRNILVLGDDDCGKSGLARILYGDLRQRGFIPVIMRGEDFRRRNTEGAIAYAIEQAILGQYVGTSAEPFLQESPEQRVLILDDFDRAKLSREHQVSVVKMLQARFAYLIVFVSEIYTFQEISRTPQVAPFAGFMRYTIREFGRYHRERLIRKWLTMGRDDPSELDGIDKNVQLTDKTISTILGRNVLPHHPVTILTLLQMLEGGNGTNTANGAYGYMYEVLIKTALASVINPREVDEKVTYLSYIAYAMFRNRQPSLTEEELRTVHKDYCDRYDMVRDFSEVVAGLMAAEILVESSGVYRFKYRYGFYYSAAKYLQDHAVASRRELLDIADHVFNETNANLLIFYMYLTKDATLIEHIVGNARKIYARFDPCRMETDVDFLNKLAIEKPPPLQLEAGDTAAHRDELNRQRDLAEAREPQEELEDQDVGYSDDQAEIVKLAISFRTLQILGQILRNFTGSLEGPLKLDITEACYGLGMRTLSAILSFAITDLAATRQYVGSLIAERTGITDKQKLAGRTDEAIVWLAKVASVGSIKRISYAVGHSDLTNTYNKVIDSHHDLATEMIDAAIKLDHFHRIPERELRKLKEKVKDNILAYAVIRDLVADFLYLHQLPFQKMQLLGSLWEIKVAVPKMLTNRNKR